MKVLNLNICVDDIDTNASGKAYDRSSAIVCINEHKVLYKQLFLETIMVKTNVGYVTINTVNTFSLLAKISTDILK